MKRFLIRFFATSLILGILAVAWAYFWPRLTDDKTLVAPATFEAFYPSTGSSVQWEEVFGTASDAFAAEYALIGSGLDDPDSLVEQIGELSALLAATRALAQSTDWDIPPFDQSQAIKTDFSKYRNYIRLVCTLPRAQHLGDYQAALTLSETYLTRGKSTVDYMMAVAAIGLLHDAGSSSAVYVEEWREGLGRAIKSEYYFARASPDLINLPFLFQGTKTWNKMWVYLSLIDESIQKDEIATAHGRGEAIVTEWMRWPYSNLVGDLLLAMAVPPLTRLYENSLELEQRILAPEPIELE